MHVPSPSRVLGRRFLLLLPIVALSLGAAVARAQTEVDVPFSGTIAEGDVVSLIAPGGTVNGPVTNNGQLWFNNPDLTSSTVSSVISGSGAVLFLQPVTVTMSAANTYTGGTYVYGGTVAVTGALQGGAGVLEIDGASGTQLTISGAGSVSNAETTLATTAAQFGDVTVSGGTWSPGTLYAGFSGSSTVTVGGGAVSAGTSYFGRTAGSTGNLALTSGSFTSSDSIFMGYSGTSSLSVSGGTLSTTNELILGYLNGGASTLSAGTITVGSKLTVGQQAVASLTVSGGSLSSASAIIGQSSGGSGTVTMNGSLWQVTGDLEVGSTNGGTGNLVLAGGSVTSGRGLIGNLSGSTGTVTVSSGTFTLNGSDPGGNLRVGQFGNGTLNVAGGTVTAAGAIVGNSSGGTGTVTVNGGQLTISGLTNIGYFSAGTFSLSSGTVTTAQVVVGGENFLGNLGQGTVNVTGGTWNSSLSFTVGQGGNGTYTQSGGTVTAAAGYIGSANTLATAGTGSVSVTGGTLAYAGNLNLGNSQAGSTGSGTLTIGGSGFVSVADTLLRASNGTLNLNSGGTLSIGVGGLTGTLPTDVLNNGLLIFNRSTPYTYSNAISGNGAVSKFGNSQLTISGTNTYTGATNVFAGTVSVIGQLADTAVTVHSTATLIGNGSIVGPVTIDPAGTVRPGVGNIGTLTIGDFTMNGATSLAAMEIIGSSTSQYDRLVAQAADALTWGGGSLSLNMSGTTSYAEGTEFYLFSGFGSYSGNVSGISLNAAGTDFAGLSFTDAGDGTWRTNRNGAFQYLEFTPGTGTLAVVPEPATVISLATVLVSGTLLAWRRRLLRRAAARRAA